MPSIQDCLCGPDYMVSTECMKYDVDNPFPDGDVDLYDLSIILRIIKSPPDGILNGCLWKPPNHPLCGEAIIVALDGSFDLVTLDDYGCFSCEVPFGWIGFYRYKDSMEKIN